MFSIFRATSLLVKSAYICETKIMNKHILEDISLQWHKILVWTIDISYFYSSHPKYDEACDLEKANHIFFMYMYP